MYIIHLLSALFHLFCPHHVVGYMYLTIYTINSEYFPTQHLAVAAYNEHATRSLYGRNSRFVCNLEECL